MEKETDDLKNDLSKIELFKQQQFIKLQSDYDAIALQHKHLVNSINVEKEKQITITKHKNVDLEIS